MYRTTFRRRESESATSLRWPVRLASVAISLLGLCLPSGVARAQLTTVFKDDDDGLRMLHRMTVSPAGEPRPALEHRFLAPAVDQVHADAATLYYQALAEGADWLKRWEDDDRIQSWQDMPLADLPLAEMKSQFAAVSYAELANSLTEAAAADRCNWEIPIRQFGATTILYASQQMRGIARALSLRTRLEIGQHQHAEALKTLRLSYALSRHLGHGPSIVQSLIGLAIQGLTDDRVRDLIADGDSPNLYWALTELAARPVELRDGMSYEAHFWDFSIHQLPELDQRALTPAEALEIAKQMHTLLDYPVLPGPWNTEHELALVSSAVATEPEARAYLAEHGFTAERIDAMPILQRCLLYRWRQFAEVRDNHFKWTLLPDDEARERQNRLTAQNERIEKTDTGASFAEALPADVQCLGAQLRLQRDMNLLRTVEALRMYAAEHRSWPKSLADVTAVVVPLDPVTGKPFEYLLADGIATLTAPGHLRAGWERQFFEVRYELTLRKPTADK